MYTQLFNNELYYMFNTIELVSFVLFASILVIAFVLFVGITKNVSIPYLRSWLSKDKYMAIFLDKSHRVKFLSASMKSNVVEASGKPAAAWVKKDYNGSYTLGALKADILTGDVAHIYDDKYINALEVLERLGITDEFDACALLTAWQAEKNGLELNAAPILDRLAELPTSADLDILIPAFSRCKFGELGRWIKLTPENIESWKDGEIEEFKRKSTRKDGTLKSGISGGTIAMIGALAVGGLILVMALSGGV